MACKYLASIPRADQPPIKDPKTLTPLPFKFPDAPVVEDVHVDMVSPITQVSANSISGFQILNFKFKFVDMRSGMDSNLTSCSLCFVRQAAAGVVIRSRLQADFSLLHKLFKTTFGCVPSVFTMLSLQAKNLLNFDFKCTLNMLVMSLPCRSQPSHFQGNTMLSLQTKPFRSCFQMD